MSVDAHCTTYFCKIPRRSESKGGRLLDTVHLVWRVGIYALSCVARVDWVDRHWIKDKMGRTLTHMTSVPDPERFFLGIGIRIREAN